MTLDMLKDTEADFVVRFRNGQLFKGIMQILADITDDPVRFFVTSEKIYARFMDTSRVSMLILELPYESFDEYLVTREGAIAIEIPNLVKIPLKRVKKEEAISLLTEGDKLNIQLYSDIIREYFVNTHILIKPLDPEPNITHGISCKIVLSTLERILEDIKSFSNKVIITANYQMIEFDEVTDDNQYHSQLDRNNQNILGLENYNGTNQQTTYSLKYLLSFIKTAKRVFDVAELKFSTNMPIEIECMLPHTGKIQFFLAPRIESV
jgi:proliferating cell nuclear antigen PCNA